MLHVESIDYESMGIAVVLNGKQFDDMQGLGCNRKATARNERIHN